MFKKKLEIIFSVVVIVSLVVLLKNMNDSYKFKINDISQDLKVKIIAKEQEILHNMQKSFGFVHKFPLVVTDEFKGKLYGLTSYKDGIITIYLNKKVMKESMDYVVESVIAHEYAHALLFQQGEFKSQNEGHSELWKRTCMKLGGKDCQQYVDSQEIIMAKLPFSSYK